MVFRLEAPAKINWFLSVVGKRNDGYHNIESVIQCIDLYDSLSFDYADDIILETDLDIPVYENLVYKSANLLRDYAHFSGGCRIVLKKNIPVTAGLGGGSSDAAYTLTGLNRLWGLGLARSELLRLAAMIGSDVPSFVHGNVTFVEGRGERVRSLDTVSLHNLLLVKPSIAVPASYAYSRCRIELTKKPNDIKLLSLALGSRDYRSLQAIVFNDLEPQVIREYPVIGEIKGMLLAEGAHIALMSGSGPTVFGVFDTFEQAERASLHLGEHWCRAVRTLN